MRLETSKLLFDIKHAALGIQLFCDGRTYEEFESDLMLRSAVERQFEIIGEAMRRLRSRDPATFDLISHGPRVIGFRNVLTHGYDVVEHSKTWQIAQEDLPLLLKDVSRLMRE